MNMHLLDWAILGGLALFICGTAYGTKKYTQSVADYLSASRCAGRYLLAVSEGISGLGAVSIVAFFEMYYKAGFTAVWWASMLLPVTTIVALSGWIQYRFRETRAMTMAQFFEVRYSRRFRVFAGMLAFVSGTINFGIFPAVGGRFFQYFCGLPTHLVSLGALEIDVVYAGIMFILLTISLAFTFMGGQIAVMVTDFFQGFFCNVALVVIMLFLLWRFDWTTISQALATAQADASLIDPIRTSGTDNFGVSYFLIGAFGSFFTFMAWQGSQGYYSAARTPHEAKMGRVLGVYRTLVTTLPIVLLSVCAFTFLHHVDFAQGARVVNGVLDSVGNPQLQSQLRVTVALTHILPVGLTGIFAAVMFAAFVSTHDTYLHSWGSIFVQDIVLPIRNTLRGDREPLSPKAHIRWLRAAVTGVAVFIFLFSLLFQQQQDILMFFALTGTIWLGWAGAAIVGGLYWRHGTTAGAWTAAIVGAFLAVGGWYMTYFWPNCQQFAAATAPSLWASALERWPALAGGPEGTKCPINAQLLWGFTMLSTSVSYVIASLLTSPKGGFNIEQMLHRGRYARNDEPIEQALPATGWKVLGTGKDFSRGDKVVFLGSYAYILIFFGVFLVGTFYALRHGISNAAWDTFWHGYCWLIVILAAAITIWLGIGGFHNLGQLFRMLRTVKRDARDDGSVVGHKNLDELDQEEVETALAAEENE